MKRFIKTRKHSLSRKGFSLVEVLCAIVLLALVATPILQALYSGMVINNKSRKMLAAADLASDTMEFISSLAFNDFTYTQSGSTIKVPGLKSYYWGNDIIDGDPTWGTIQFSSYKLRSAQLLYPDGPHAEVDYCGYTSTVGWDTATNNRYVVFKNVQMDGYNFSVKISTKAPTNKVVIDGSTGDYVSQPFEFGDLTAEKYYCYDVKVEVIEPGTNKVLATAATTVPNRF